MSYGNSDGQEVTGIWNRDECRLTQAILELLCWNEGSIQGVILCWLTFSV